MSWEVRTQMSNPSAVSNEMEWCAVQVDTQEEAEAWWQCRMNGKSVARRVHVMMNPEGEVVRVAMN